MISTIQKKVAQAGGQVRSAFLGIVARGSAKALQLKGFADEVLQETELFQHVGFSSHVPTTARAVIIPLQGKTSKSIVVATSGGAIQIDVSDGETCIYNQFGHSVWLKEDGTHIKGDLFVESGNLNVVDGDVIDKTGSMQDMRDAYNKHKHGSSPTPDQPL